MKKKIGFYGGSFDPIHHGHIQIALQALESSLIDEVLFCPAGVSPFKTHHAPKANGFHRMNMVTLAIEDIEGFTITDEEIKRPGPSYTIDSMLSLQKKNSNHEFYLILADDQLKGFSLWKEAQRLSKLFPLLIGSRLFSSFDQLPKDFFPVSENHCFFGPKLEISSTYLRERLKKGLYCRHLTPPKVLDYIHRHGLYLTD